DHGLQCALYEIATADSWYDDRDRSRQLAGGPHVSDPLISVITPFLNAGPFLSQAIESVVHQTYSNWELILIDDGSGDESSGIAREYTASMPEKIATIE